MIKHKKIVAAFFAVLLSIPFTQNIQASVTTKIKLPKGYTVSRIARAGRGNKRQIRILRKISCRGMKINKFEDTNSRDQRTVTPVKLNKHDQREISKYALAVINSARRQTRRSPWRYSAAAQHFANSVAYYYHKRGTSDWDSGHDLTAILRAASLSGLKTSYGQVYEDEAGLPISDQFHGQTRTMKQLKADVYFNLEQMFFGGYTGNNYNDLSRYFEYEHACDLLSLNQPRSWQKRQFAISFSNINNHNYRISVHMMGVPRQMIQNRHRFR